MFDDSKCASHYYKKMPQVCAVMIVSNHVGDVVQYVQVFRLTQKQYISFARGKLSLIPTGCCCETGRQYIEGPDIMFRGRFKNKKHIQAMVTAVENILLNEGRECK